ncbi:MAG TPA: fatty acid desaturase [Acidimicrobiales bacterium]|nr:fatty acid desaturase [Acidimicrobiales bacterium]
MAASARERDYSLTGAAAALAVAAGLADAEWYRPPVDPERLRALTERNNWRPARDTALWLALLGGTGTAAFMSLGTWWAIPAFAAFGALYGGSADPRWHENGHATAFKAKWANDVFYHLAAFMLLREGTLWRWSHFRHHSDTIIVGRDAEISFPRPTRLGVLLLNYLNLINGPKMLWLMAQHAAGRTDPTTRELVPEEDFGRVTWEARAYLSLLAGVVAWAVASGTVLPLLFFGLPSFYGAWMIWFFAITQHAGLKEDVLDHRLNTRTVYMNPVFRFLYLNMNYHLEHHLFPSVPYYNLPALHEEIKAYLPPPKPSVLAAYKEIVHALRMQRRDPTWELPAPYLPPGGTPPSPRLPGEVDRGEPPAPPLSEVDLGPSGAFLPGQVVRIDREGSSYALYCLAANDFALTDGLCTHAGTHLADGHLEGHVIECPKHNGRFDVRTGEAIRRPATVPLRSYPVRTVGGRVVADLRPNLSRQPVPPP